MGPLSTKSLLERKARRSGSGSLSPDVDSEQRWGATQVLLPDTENLLRALGSLNLWGIG